MKGSCSECGHKNPVPASLCLWCHDLGLLAGGFAPPRLEERWTDEELTLMRSRAAARARRLMTEAALRKAARRRHRAEVGRVEDGQAVFI